MTSAGSPSTLVKVGSGIGLTLGGLTYFLSLFNYALDPLRTASVPGYWSNLYDIQARALIDGHLSVPTGSLGIEGIVHDGKTHMYFPLFPALLRLPVLLTTHEFDGKLTLISMGLAWVLFATMATRLFWLVLRVVTNDAPPTRLHAGFAAVLIAAATGGTTLTYDASLPWIYNEAYVWAAAAAVGAMYWMVRVLTDGEALSVRWLGGFVLLAVLTRPTEGWAVGIVTIAMAVWVATGRVPAVGRRMWWQLLLAGILPLVLGVVISEIKFDTVYLHPLSEQVWTSVSQHRREALAANGGSLTGPQFFLTSFMAYFRVDGIRFVDYFPWITLPAHPAPAYGSAFVDQSYRTGSVTAFMPLLLVLSLLAAFALLRPGAPKRVRVLLPPLVAGIVITGGVMAYGYYSFRYVTDFVPALVFGAFVSTAFLLRWSDRHRGVGIGVLSIAAFATVFAMVAHLAVGYWTAAVSASGAQLRTYVEHQVALSGPGLAKKVTFSRDVPTHDRRARTDELMVVGDCDGLYLNTGDAYRPWATVAERGLEFVVDPAQVTQPGTATLFETSAGSTGALQTTADGRARVLLATPGERTIRGEWHLLQGLGMRVRVENATELEFFRVSTTPGGQVGGLPASEHDSDFNYEPVSASAAPDLQAEATPLGLQIVSRRLPAPKVCRDVAALK